MPAFVIVMIWVACFEVSTGLADERLRLDAKINGKPARLCFDSGSGSMVLFREAAQRFGLRVFEASTNAATAPGKVAMGTSEECVLNLEGEEHKTRFRVVDIPGYVNMDADGVVGWRNVRGNVLSIDAVARRITFLPRVPRRVSSWVRLAFVTNSDSLSLEIPHTDDNKGIVCVDTGTDMGVMLTSPQWQVWKAAHPHQPLTLKAHFTPADGIVVVEEAWATQFSFGPLVLADIPMSVASPVDVALGGSRYEGTMGLAALRRVEAILDCKHGVAYLRPRKMSPAPYQHNRLGAVFVSTADQSDDLVARVADGR